MTLMPLVMASVVGVAVSQSLGGQDSALFSLHGGSTDYRFTLSEMLPFILLGVTCGMVGYAIDGDACL